MFANLEKSGRIETIDLLKLFASILVIFGHCMLKFIPGSEATPLYNFIWLTQMPLFMFCSGFVNSSISKCDVANKFLRRIIKNCLVLLVPCFTYLLINSLISNISITDAFVNFYFDPQTNLWFLWVLFVIHIIFDLGLYIASKIKTRINIFFPVCLLLLVSFAIFGFMFLDKSFNFNILSLKLIAYYSPFFCFGYLFHLLINKNVFKKKPFIYFSYVIVVVFGMFLVFECFYFKSIYSFDDSKISYLALRVLGSISSIIVAVFLCDLLIQFGFFKKISKYGAFSLQSYYLHILLVRLLDFKGETVIAQWSLCFAGVAILLVSIILILVALFFIPYLHLIVFGKSFSIYKFEKRLPSIFK